MIADETNWKLEPLRPRTPCIRLTNVPEGLNNTSFRDAFFQPNNTNIQHLSRCRDELVIHKYRGNFAHVQIPPELWQALQDVPELFMRQRLVRLQDHYPLVQCFTCGGYGHTATKCQRKDPICLSCSGKHPFSICSVRNDKEELCCINCHNDPKTTETDHAANDYAHCPQAKQRQDSRKKQTIYDVFIYRTLMHFWYQAGKRTRRTQQKKGPPSLNPEQLNEQVPLSTMQVDNDSQTRETTTSAAAEATDILALMTTAEKAAILRRSPKAGDKPKTAKSSETTKAAKPPKVPSPPPASDEPADDLFCTEDEEEDDVDAEDSRDKENDSDQESNLPSNKVTAAKGTITSYFRSIR